MHTLFGHGFEPRQNDDACGDRGLPETHGCLDAIVVRDGDHFNVLGQQSRDHRRVVRGFISEGRLLRVVDHILERVDLQGKPAEAGASWRI